jgi:hypothetical protein
LKNTPHFEQVISDRGNAHQGYFGAAEVSATDFDAANCARSRCSYS